MSEDGREREIQERLHSEKVLVLKVAAGNLPGVAARLRGPRHPADGFATVGGGFSPLAERRRARGIKTPLRTGGTPQSVAAVCGGRGEAAGGGARGSGVPAPPGS